MSQIDHEIENLLYQLDNKLDEFQFPQADEQLEISINLFLQILHHIFVNYDTQFYNFLIEKNFLLYSQDDYNFVEIFKQKPSITLSQFFNNGFLKQKIIFCIESANLIQKWIKQNKIKPAKKEKNSQAKYKQYNQYDKVNHISNNLQQEREYSNIYQNTNQYGNTLKSQNDQNKVYNQNNEYQNEYGEIQQSKPQNLHRYVESNCSVVDMNFNQKINHLQAPALFQKKDNSQISQGSQNMKNSQTQNQYKKNQRFNTNDIDFGEMIKQSQEYEFNQKSNLENDQNNDQTYHEILVGLSQNDESIRKQKQQIQNYDKNHYEQQKPIYNNSTQQSIIKKSSKQSEIKEDDQNQTLLQMIKQTNENLVLLSKNVKKQLDTINQRLTNLESRVTLIEKESKLNHTYH